MQNVSLPAAGPSAEEHATVKVLESVALAVARSKRTVLLVGAGISTNAGIPDFRSSASGLYSSPPAASSMRPARTVTPPPTLSGPALFSASVYSSPDTTAEHLRFISAFKQSLDTIILDASSSSTGARPVTNTHGFMRLLKKRGKLLRVYTQNIDGLEGVGTGLSPVMLAGITPNGAAPISTNKGKGKAKMEGDFVQLHGSVHTVRCTACDFVRAWVVEDGEAFAWGSVGACPQCEERALIRLARGQRTLSSLSRAFLRPSITLYNESPPSSAALTIGSLSVSDLSSSPGPDVMLVMGTSLRIPGFKKLVKEFARSVKSRGGVRILVNREEIGSKSEWKEVFDYQVIADTDVFVTRVIADWKRLRPQDWTGKQATLGELFATRKSASVIAAKSVKEKGPPRSPRKALAALSPNLLSQAVSSTTVVAPLHARAPTSPTTSNASNKRLRQPESATPSPPAKRIRQPLPLIFSPSTPSLRTTRNSQRVLAGATSVSPPPPAPHLERYSASSACWSPSKTRPDSRRLTLGQVPASQRETSTGAQPPTAD